MGPKGKKGRRGDSDSEDEKVAERLKALEVADKQPKKDKKKDKAKAGGGKGGKGRNDSDDEDPLAIMKRLAAAADSDSGDEEPAPAVPLPKKAAAPPPAPAPAPKAAPPTPKPAPADDDDDDEDEGSDEEKNSPSKPSHGKMSKAERKKQKSAQKSKVTSQTVAPPTSFVPDKEEEDDDSEEEEKHQVKEKKAAESSVATSSQTSAPAAVTTSAPAPAPAPAPATATAPAPAPAPAPSKAVPKTKLELKLEKARADKAAADEAKATAEAVRVAEEKRQAKEAKRIEKEQEALAAAAAPASSSANAASVATEGGSGTSKVGAQSQSPSKPSAAAAAPAAAGADSTLTEEEREARLKATLYGDDVFDEYAKPGQDTEGGAAGGDDGKKLSRKELRKAAAAAEAKEREVEYNKAAMKASAEGAQFACSQSIVDPNDPQWLNALDVVIPSISISAHSKELFVNTELNIAHGRRYGLVGPNGMGKSTLLKMIAAGELKLPPRIDFLYVEQEVLADETPAVDAVLKADKVRWALVEEEKAILKEIDLRAAAGAASSKANSDKTEALDVRLGEIYEQLANINASSAEARARRILFGLGFDAEMQVRPTKYFSGGWRMRISLARALFIEPTLLMLDEPTNHLDLNAVIWLDDYLQKWKKTLLVVSHDQDFLNSVCQEILHIDDKKLITYRGNYDTFKELEAQKNKAQQKAWEKQEKRLRELKAKGVTKQNAEKKAIEEKSKKREPGARSKKAEAAAVASGGTESNESQVELIKRPREYEVAFEFPEVVHLSPPILEVRDVNFRYGPNLPLLFQGLNFGLDMESRVCIVGPNGSGKSTILKIITGDLDPPEGEVRRNPRLRVGVYNQHFVDRLPMEEDPVTYLRRLFSEETYQSCRNILGRYGLEGHAHTIPIRDLSGGQKARVVFVELSLMAPHLLFLDEPTNNLDIESIDALCDALKLFNGGVVLVSHDARLIETTNCQLWVVEEQNVTPWESGFQGYRDHLLAKLEAQLAAIMPGAGERPK